MKTKHTTSRLVMSMLLLVVTMMGLVGCGDRRSGPDVLIPPTVDLAPHGDARNPVTPPVTVPNQGTTVPDSNDETQDLPGSTGSDEVQYENGAAQDDGYMLVNIFDGGYLLWLPYGEEWDLIAGEGAPKPVVFDLYDKSHAGFNPLNDQVSLVTVQGNVGLMRNGSDGVQQLRENATLEDFKMWEWRGLQSHLLSCPNTSKNGSGRYWYLVNIGTPFFDGSNSSYDVYGFDVQPLNGGDLQSLADWVGANLVVGEAAPKGPQQHVDIHNGVDLSGVDVESEGEDSIRMYVPLETLTKDETAFGIADSGHYYWFMITRPEYMDGSTK